jgi:hypothetical protein
MDSYNNKEKQKERETDTERELVAHKDSAH